MGWVDADAHVVESPHTWDYLTPSERKFRPMLFQPDQDNQKAHWVSTEKFAAYSVLRSAKKISIKNPQPLDAT